MMEVDTLATTTYKIVVACDKREHLGLITMTMAKIRDTAGNA